MPGLLSEPALEEPVEGLASKVVVFGDLGKVNGTAWKHRHWCEREQWSELERERESWWVCITIYRGGCENKEMSVCEGQGHWWIG